MDCDVRFIVADDSVGSHSLVPDHGFFRLILVLLAQTSVHCLILSIFSCMFQCRRTHTHSLKHFIMSVRIVLVPIWVMLILCVLLSHQIVDIACICSLLLSVIYIYIYIYIYILYDVMFVMPDLVLLLFHFQFLLSHLTSTAVGMWLLH